MKNSKQIIIELTPLLDVIMIMLFFIISEYQNHTNEIIKESNDTINQQESIIEQMQNDLSASQNQLELANGILSSYEYFNEYADIVAVRIINDDTQNRKIIVNGKNVNESIEFNWDSLIYAKNSLEGIIKKYNESKTPVFITFSYNSNTIFKQDYDFIEQILHQIDNNYVYVKYDSNWNQH